MHRGYRDQCSATTLHPRSKLPFSPILHDNSSSDERDKGKDDHLLIVTPVCRSSRLQMFFKTRVLQDFATFTGKHLCWSSLWKFEALRLATSLKVDSGTGVFL